MFQNFSGFKLCRIGGVSRLYRLFLSHSTIKLRGGMLLSFRKARIRKKFMDKKGGVTFFRRFFLSQYRRKISRANLSVFQKCYAIKFFCLIWVSQFC